MMPSAAERGGTVSTVVTISAWYEVVTPLFCAGARQDDVGVRPASLRGILRWWWRATRYGVYDAGCNGDPRQALRELDKEEKKLFGSSETGQGRVALRVERAKLAVLPRRELLRTSERNGASVVGPGARYLGYGLVEAASTKSGKRAGQLVRSCGRAAPGTSVRVDLVCRGLDEAQLDTLEIALDALGLFGGLGARSRRGWGSLLLLKRCRYEGWPTQPEGEAESSARRNSLRDFKGLQEQLASLLKKVTSGGPDYPPISAFGPKSRVVVVPYPEAPLDPYPEAPLDALDEVGRELVRYRSWGRNGFIFGGRADGEPAEQNFRDDHDLMKGSEKPISHPRRAVFGLPQGYGNDTVKPVKPEAGVGREMDRRASPLLLHVHRLEDDRYQSAVVCTALPAQFLPSGVEIEVRNTPVKVRPPAELYAPVDQFLDRLVHQRGFEVPGPHDAGSGGGRGS
jgi:CRISPR-associated protein Cmr1